MSANRKPAGRGYAGRCEECAAMPNWQITRNGDVVMTWACDPHLALTCDRMQRDFEITELVIVYMPKVLEWYEIAQAHEAIEDPTGAKRQARDWGHR